MKSRGWLFILSAVSLQLLFTGPAGADSATAPREKVVIAQWGQEKILLYLPLYIAMEEGFFREEGLDVELRYSGNDNQVFATVISGEAAFGVGDPVFAAIAKEKGFPGKVVALMVRKLGNSGISKKEALHVMSSPAELKGYRIATFPSPSTTFTLVSQLLDESFPKGSDQIVQTAIGSQIAALEGGSADIAVDLEPSISVAESKGYKVVFSFDRFAPELAITGLTTSEELIKNKPKVAAAVVRGLDRALQLIAADHSKTTQLAARLFPKVESATIARAVSRMLDLGVYPESSYIPDDLWQRTLAIRLKSGELKSVQTTDRTVDNQFSAATRQLAQSPSISK